MKSLKPTIHAVVSTLLLLATSLAFGRSFANPKFPANANGAVMADEFGKWQFQSQTGISSGAQTVTLNGCYIKVGTSYEEFYPIAVNVPLYITDGTNSEAVHAAAHRSWPRHHNVKPLARVVTSFSLGRAIGPLAPLKGSAARTCQGRGVSAFIADPRQGAPLE